MCHDTLGYGRYPDSRPALCRGFHDRFGDRSNFIRVTRRLGGFTVIAPPGQENPVTESPEAPDVVPADPLPACDTSTQT
jgi:hypothetical protein